MVQVSPKQKDDKPAAKTDTDKSRAGYFGDWLQRGGDPAAALAGYLTKTALSKEFGVSERTIDRWRSQPDGLPYTSAGATVLFNIVSVRKWLDKRERHPNRRRTAA